MKYKVGDKVRIRSDLILNEKYGTCYFVNRMKQYKGTTVTIEKVYVDYYKIKQDKDWNYSCWTDEMIEGKVEDMENKIYTGLELMKLIEDGKIEEDTEFGCDLGEHVIYKLDEIYIGDKHRTARLLNEEYTLKDILRADYELLQEPKKKEINIQDISEFEEIRNISTWSNETLSENQRLIIIKINALIRALKQLDKKENN